MNANSGSEFNLYFRAIRKRWWVIVLLLFITVATILLSSLAEKPVYQTFMSVQVLPVEPQEVSLFGQLRVTSTQEEILLVEQQFISALRNGYVAWQTIADLDLGISAADLLNNISASVADDFIYITFQADDPLNIEAIANTHFENALAYYGQIRAKPSTVALNFIAQQLANEENNFKQAQTAFLQFKADNHVNDLNREILAVQDLIRNLRMERERMAMTKAQNEKRRSETLAAAAAAYEEARSARSKGDREAESYYTNLARQYEAGAASDSVEIAVNDLALTQYDQLITAKEQELADLIQLTAQYDYLERAVERVQSNYNFLLSKESEARLKQSQAANVSFIQIIEPPRTPDRPAPSRLPKLLAVGVVVSILGGVILAFVLELLSRGGRPHLAVE